MTPSRPTALTIGGAMALALAFLQAPASEPILLREETSGTATLEGQRRLRLAQVNGTLYIRLGAPGEVRFAARIRDNRREPHEVALWLVDDTLEFRPVEGMESTPILLEVSVPPELTLEVLAEETYITLSGLHSDMRIQGRNLEIEGHGLMGAIELELSDGRIKLSDLEQSLDVRLEAATADLSRVRQDLRLTAVESDVVLNQIDGEVDIDVDRSTVDASFLSGLTAIEASGGSLRLSDLRTGAEILVEDTPIELFRANGKVVIDTNAETRFQELDCDLEIRGYGSSLRGSGNLRRVKVTTDSALVAVENLGAGLFVEGDRLAVSGKNVQGEVRIVATSSEIELEKLAEGVFVQNEYGDVRIADAVKKVQIDSREGDITVSGQKGALQVQANGNRVEVRWQDAPQEDSIIENEGGEVWVLLPLKWVGTVEAETEFGRIESNVNGVVVDGTGTRASGLVRRRTKPRLQIKSGGDIFLNSSVPGRDE